MFSQLKSGIAPTLPKQPMEQERSVVDINSNQVRRNRPQVKVFNIPENTDKDDLEEFFSSCGDVKFVKILPVRDGKTSSLGFVEFETTEECEKAIAEKNDTEFNGEMLRVLNNNRDTGAPASSLSNGFSNKEGKSSVKIYNIPDGTNEDDIRALFSQAGQVKDVKILPCREGKVTTLGFVYYNSNDEAMNAVSQLDGFDFQDSTLKVVSENNNAPTNGFNRRSLGNDQAVPPPMGRGARLLANLSQTRGGQRDGKPQAKVFGIPRDTTEDEVIEFFANAGQVLSVRLLPILEGKDNHLGFVEFATNNEVEEAVRMFDGMEFQGSLLKVMAAAPRMQNGGSERRDGNANFSPNEFLMGACRRCGEEGHFARECVNAPAPGFVQAVTYIPPPPPETENEIFEQGVNQGINFEKYQSIPVELTGNNVPKRLSSFSDASLHEVCMKNVKRARYNVPTPVQQYALPVILAKRDLMACAQTGSGKTASFLLPVITNLMNDGLPSCESDDGPVCPLATIIAPTRELAVQIFMEARKFSYNSPLKPCVVYGGISVHYQLERLGMGCHLLVATPGRLNDFINRGKVSFRNLKYLILDEADRMIDMGFGPQIQQIITNSEMPPKGKRNTLLFSATFPEEIQKLATDFLHDYLFLTIGRVGGTCTDVHQTIIQVPAAQKRNTLETILQESGTDRTLVFVEKKRDADFLASVLSQHKFPATSLSSDRSQKEREDALGEFKNGNASVLVATAVAARGLDINDVKHVINYDLPNDDTEYVHRIGRTGRIGNKGKSTSFFDSRRDAKLARSLVKLLSDAEQEVPDWLEECALSAIGTGYGIDGTQFKDRRSVPERGSGGVPQVEEDDEW